MILADKILTLRKNAGWSQEELAEKLNVSRQSISKWEGAASIPDIGKIVDMSKLFGVTTDYLLNDDAEQIAYSDSDGEGLPQVGAEEANAFMRDSCDYARKLARGVSLCILSPVLLIVLPVGIGAAKSFAAGGAAVETREALGAGIGIVALLIMVACAVAIFIMSSAAMKRYEYIDNGNFELAYGVEGIVRERRAAGDARRTAMITAGVVLCILSPVPLIISGLIGATDLIYVLLTGLLLVIVAVAVYMFITVSGEKECCDKLLREEDYAPEMAELNRRTGSLGGIYWPVVTAGYLAWSFIGGRWDITWLVWPVAGVLFGAVCAIVKIMRKR